MPGSVDKVELVLPAIRGAVGHADRVQLDRNPALALQFVGVEHLVAHPPPVHGGRGFEKPVSQSGLAVIDVGDDAEIANQVGPHLEQSRDCGDRESPPRASA